MLKHALKLYISIVLKMYMDIAWTSHFHTMDIVWESQFNCAYSVYLAYGYTNSVGLA